jgi:Flp pilus assembly pilin Flp
MKMNIQWRFRRKQQSGQGMTEYIVIVALIAIAGIAAFQFFGQTIRSQTAGIANEVAGKSAADAVTEAQARAADVLAEGKKKKGLDNYKNDNSH